MTSSLLWSLILALHLICMVYWIGGAIYCLQLKRATRLLDATETTTVLLQSYSRFLRTLWHVIPAAIITGIALVIRMEFALPWPYHLMAGCGIIMILLFLSMIFGPLRTARRAIRPQPQLFISLHRRTACMALFGIVAIIAGALGHGA